MLIREERPADQDLVIEVQRSAFGEQGGKVAGLIGALRESLVAGRDLSLVAELDGEVVGQVMFSRSLLDAPGRLVEVTVLSPLGVRPDRQRQGIGSQLVRHGLQVMAERDVPLVFLEGSPDYYRRLGFQPATELGFIKPSLRIPDAAFQVYPLPAWQPWMTGTLVYPPAFWEHDAVGLRDTAAGGD